jgi:hypothetical protein
MTYKYCFETIPRVINHPGRIRDRLSKQIAREQARKQKGIAVGQRETAQIRSLIASLESAIASLDGSIGADLERSSIQDPRHYAFPISARTMITRRENLRGTVDALSERLAKVEQPKPPTALENSSLPSQSQMTYRRRKTGALAA